jgi:hypothetical protein
MVAGWNVVLVSSSRLTVLGLGNSRSAGDSWYAADSGILRPKRVPAIPIAGSVRSL